MISVQHGAGAGQAQTVETAPIQETDRARMARAGAHNREKSCCNTAAARCYEHLTARYNTLFEAKGMTMVAGKEIAWEEVSAPGFEHTPRKAWRAAVGDIADKAKARFPACTGRVDSAVTLVLAGDVELQADGTAQVASQRHSTAAYLVVNGECSCKDFAKAPHGLCKHRV